MVDGSVVPGAQALFVASVCICPEGAADFLRGFDYEGVYDGHPPEQINNGRRLFVEIKPVDGAAQYKGYVAAYPDGRGAKALAASSGSDARGARWIEKPNQLFYEGCNPRVPCISSSRTSMRMGTSPNPQRSAKSS